MNGGTARPLDIRPDLGKVATMKGRQEDKQLAAELAAMLEPRFPGMAIIVGDDDRWDLVRHDVYCDCQVVPTAQPAPAELHAGAT